MPSHLVHAHAGSPIAILARQQQLAMNARRQLQMSQCNSAAAVPVIVHRRHTDLADESTASLGTMQRDDAQTDSQEIFPADQAEVHEPAGAASANADLTRTVDAVSPTADPANPADPAAVAAQPVQSDGVGGFPSLPEQHLGAGASDNTAARHGREADSTVGTVSQSTLEEAEVPSVRALIHSAAASVTDPSRPAETQQQPASIPAMAYPQGPAAKGDVDTVGVWHRHEPSMPAQTVLSQHPAVAEPSSGGVRVAMQYPWMDPSDQPQGPQQSLPSQQEPGAPHTAQDVAPVHVTFATGEALCGRCQGDKIPLRYLAAAAADKAQEPSAEKGAWQQAAAPAQSGVSDGSDTVQAATRGMQTGNTHPHSLFGDDAQSLQRRRQPDQVDILAVNLDAQQDATNRRSVVDDDEITEQQDRTDAVSVASFANSAASGLGHLMRAQQPWSESSSSPDRTSANGSAEGRDFSQLQAEVMSQPDAENHLLPPALSQPVGDQQSQQQLLLIREQAQVQAAEEVEHDKQQLPQQNLAVYNDSGRPSWVLDQQLAQPVHDSSSNSWVHVHKAPHAQFVHDNSSRPSWADDQQLMQPVQEGSNNSRSSWVQEQQAVHVQPVLGSGGRPSWAVDQQTQQPVHEGGRPSWAVDQQTQQPVHEGGRPSWAVDQQTQQVIQQGSRPSWAVDQQTQQPVHEGSRPSWAVDQQTQQPVHEGSSNSRASWVRDQQAVHVQPASSSGGRPSWALDQLAGGVEAQSKPVTVLVPAVAEGALGQQHSMAGTSQPSCERMQGEHLLKLTGESYMVIALCVCTSRREKLSCSTYAAQQISSMYHCQSSWGTEPELTRMTAYMYTMCSPHVFMWLCGVVCMCEVPYGRSAMHVKWQSSKVGLAAVGGEGLENAASEVSEAYSEVFEEDMPQPAADDDMSDAASVRSSIMSVNISTEPLRQPGADYAPSNPQGKSHACVSSLCNRV